MQICACMQHGNRQVCVHIVSSAKSLRDSSSTSRAITTHQSSCTRHCLGTDTNGSYSFKAHCNTAAEATGVQARTQLSPLPHAEDFPGTCVHCTRYCLGTHTGGSCRFEAHRSMTAGAMGVYLNRKVAQTLVHSCLVFIQAGAHLHMARFPAGQHHLYYLTPD